MSPILITSPPAACANRSMGNVLATTAVVTAEEHMLNGGLGDSIAQLLSTKMPTPVEMIGVDDMAIVRMTI